MQQAWKKYFDPQALSSLSELRLRSRRRLSGALAGAHRGYRMGPAMEFAQHRQYSPGDDLRYIDWKIFGRTDKFFLKQSEEETNLTCYVVVDCSESMAFAGRTSELTKLDYAKRLAFALMIIGIGQHDPVACGLAREDLTDYLPPSNASAQLSMLDDALEQTEAIGGTNLPKAIGQLLEIANSCGLIILISDLLGNHDMRSLATILQASGHDATVMHVMDREEYDFRFDGEMRFVGLEADETVEVNASQIGTAYREEVSQFIRSQQHACWELGIGYQTVISDQPIIESLAATFGQ